MPYKIEEKQIMTDEDIIKVTDIDRFRPSLKCDLFIPSYIHSLSIATEYVYEYVMSRFPEDYFKTIHIAGAHALSDLQKFEKFPNTEKDNRVVLENPAALLSYSLQYDFNDNNLDWNWLSTNKYLKQSQWQRSFFKCPQRGLYLGIDLECMLINYNFRFRVNTRAIQLDLYNRMRKVFRLGCTETNDIDCDFHLPSDLMTKLASEAGFSVDSESGEVLDPWGFVRFLNQFSQMPIMYKLRLINQKYEYFLRMRNLPVHMDFQNPLDVDDGNQVGMANKDFTIEFQIAMRFPAPRTFSFYNEGKWIHKIDVEKNEGISVFSMKVMDIPEVNYKGWPLYGHSNYLADEDEKVVETMDIKELFVAPVDIKVDTSLDDLIQDSIDQFISPDSFIEIAVYTNDLAVGGNGRIPIKMDWENRKILLPQGMTDNYYYIAIYIDRGYVNAKVIEKTGALGNRISKSKSEYDRVMENMARKKYDQTALIEEYKFPNTNMPKSRKAKFIVNRGD